MASMTMNNISLYIPHVFVNITKEKISEIFDILSIGRVSHIDFVGKINGDGKPYNSAYIHFENWYNTDAAQCFQERVLNPDKEARLVYDDPWHWIVLENKATRNIPGQRKPRIVLDNETAISMYSTPVKMPSDDFVDACRAPVKGKSYKDALGEQKELNQVSTNLAASEFEPLQSEEKKIADEIENMMNEEEARIAAEDKYLAYIDTRYVDMMERELFYLRARCEQDAKLFRDEILCLQAENSILKEQLANGYCQ